MTPFLTSISKESKMHPFRTLKSFTRRGLRLIYRLGLAIEANTAAVRKNSKATDRLLATAQATQAATEKLAAIELHRQGQAGQRTDF
jgi:hypothetical protein